MQKYWSFWLLNSKRELGIKFNSPYFIANVLLILVHAQVYERYVNFASYCTAKKCTFIKLANMYFCCRPGSSYIGLVDERDA